MIFLIATKIPNRLDCYCNWVVASVDISCVHKSFLFDFLLLLAALLGILVGRGHGGGDSLVGSHGNGGEQSLLAVLLH